MSLEDIELWNVHNGVALNVGAQRIVNILGRIMKPDQVQTLKYSLNGGVETPVVFRRPGHSSGRNFEVGDFNIDTIDRQQLKANNVLILTAHDAKGKCFEHRVQFSTKPSISHDGDFLSRLEKADHCEQMGQVIDGCWQISSDENGQKVVEIRKEDAGYDRIILLTDEDLGEGYILKCRLRITSWLASPHNVGFVFKWNPHLQGDGTMLPNQWTTGLGYYFSHCPGLRIRYGVDVHLNEAGQKLGDHVLAEAHYSPWRYRSTQLLHHLLRLRRVIPQLPSGRDYNFELKVTDPEYALTVWDTECQRPAPQVLVRNPPKLLLQGAAGIIALQCAVQVLEFEVVYD